MKRLGECVAENFADSQFNVDRLASELGFSVRQLQRKMTATLGRKPGDYLRGFRLERARKMLESKTGGVSDIAYAVGFKNPGHFSITFRKAFGMTPTELLQAGETEKEG